MLGAMEGLQRATDSLDPKSRHSKWKKQWMEYPEKSSDSLEDFRQFLEKKIRQNKNIPKEEKLKKRIHLIK